MAVYFWRMAWARLLLEQEVPGSWQAEHQLKEDGECLGCMRLWIHLNQCNVSDAFSTTAMLHPHDEHQQGFQLP